MRGVDLLGHAAGKSTELLGQIRQRFIAQIDEAAESAAAHAALDCHSRSHIGAAPWKRRKNFAGSAVGIFQEDGRFTAHFLRDSRGGDIRPWHIPVDLEPTDPRWVQTVMGPYDDSRFQ